MRAVRDGVERVPDVGGGADRRCDSSRRRRRARSDLRREASTVASLLLEVAAADVNDGREDAGRPAEVGGLEVW